MLFGERLTLAAEDLFSVGFAAVCLIDSDSPTVPQHAYADAVRLLAQPGDRMVLGPSDDGGYYLIGLKTAHRRVFEEIDWSTERVFEQTVARAQRRSGSRSSYCRLGMTSMIARRCAACAMNC